jgi:hypothetical protein
MSKINLAPTISLNEAVLAVMLYGDETTQSFIAEPGIGKTTILRNTAIRNGDKWRRPGDYYPTDKYCYIYVESPLKDNQDVQMGMPDMKSETIKTIIGDLFMMNDPRPKCILLDEERKAPKMLQIIFQSLKLERVIGGKPLPKGSLVFSTSNSASDGVGDTVQAHGINREKVYTVRKPTAGEWAVWASNNNVDTILISWALMNKRAFDSYTTLSPDEVEKNGMIFNPRKPAQPFLSPRSLALCDTVVRKRHMAGENLTRAALHGSVGAVAGESIMAHIALANDLQRFEDIIKDPENIGIPEKIAAQIHIIINAVDEVQTQDHLTQFMKWLKRAKSNELQAIFFTMIAKNDRTKVIANMNPEIQSWLMTNKNYELL